LRIQLAFACKNFFLTDIVPLNVIFPDSELSARLILILFSIMQIFQEKENVSFHQTRHQLEAISV